MNRVGICWTPTKYPYCNFYVKQTYPHLEISIDITVLNFNKTKTPEKSSQISKVPKTLHGFSNFKYECILLICGAYAFVNHCHCEGLELVIYADII